MLTQCLEIKARGCCMHVFLVEIEAIFPYVSIQLQKALW